MLVHLRVIKGHDTTVSKCTIFQGKRQIIKSLSLRGLLSFRHQRKTGLEMMSWIHLIFWCLQRTTPKVSSWRLDCRTDEVGGKVWKKYGLWTILKLSTPSCGIFFWKKNMSLFGTRTTWHADLGPRIWLGMKRFVLCLESTSQSAVSPKKAMHELEKNHHRRCVCFFNRF